MKRLFALLLFSGFVIVSCKSGPTPSSEGLNVASPAQNEELTSEELNELSLDGKIRKGMTASNVRAAWGRPEKSIETQSRSQIKATWLYPDRGAVLYFKDGQLDSWEIKNAKYDPFKF